MDHFRKTFDPRFKFSFLSAPTLQNKDTSLKNFVILRLMVWLRVNGQSVSQPAGHITILYIGINDCCTVLVSQNIC